MIVELSNYELGLLMGLLDMHLEGFKATKTDHDWNDRYVVTKGLRERLHMAFMTQYAIDNIEKGETK